MKSTRFVISLKDIVSMYKILGYDQDSMESLIG